MNIGVFGGSFDPVHYGHLLLAQQCLESSSLDRVLFVPVAHSPLRPRSPIADAKARVEMLQLAIADHPGFAISTIELERGEISYTVDTLRALKQGAPNDTFFLLMGLDSLLDFPRWHQPQEILSLARLLVVNRPSTSGPTAAEAWQVLRGFATDEQIDAIRSTIVDSQQFEFSSTDIRQRVSSGRSVRFRTPRAVEKYIETQGLYRG
ncbi:MAG: nicotinate (nicotinamide) nucleotide adenylyltransferase [Planctomycetaceae bacterium]|jgi:nicotinate-nucleotide adenylyltransferase|nr:nicotinate (nicotinamide) nucleotide adenylyltransferase [Planctomycetaceae bacterium]